jgi:hypothetical protein
VVLENLIGQFLTGKAAPAPACSMRPGARRHRARQVRVAARRYLRAGADEFVRRLSTEVIDAVKADKAIQAGDVGLASDPWSMPR